MDKEVHFPFIFSIIFKIYLESPNFGKKINEKEQVFQMSIHRNLTILSTIQESEKQTNKK